MASKILLLISLAGYTFGVPTPGISSGGLLGFNQVPINPLKDDFLGNDFQTNPAYDFSWYVNDKYFGNDFGQSETRNGYDTTGKYFVLLPDGRRQNVKYYVNGKSGFVADVTYDGVATYPTHQIHRSDDLYDPADQQDVLDFQDLGLKAVNTFSGFNNQPHQRSLLNIQSDFKPLPLQAIKASQNILPFSLPGKFEDQTFKADLVLSQPIHQRSYPGAFELKRDIYQPHLDQSQLLNGGFGGLKSGYANI